MSTEGNIDWTTGNECFFRTAVCIWLILAKKGCFERYDASDLFVNILPFRKVFLLTSASCKHLSVKFLSTEPRREQQVIVQLRPKQGKLGN